MKRCDIPSLGHFFARRICSQTTSKRRARIDPGVALRTDLPCPPVGSTIPLRDMRNEESMTDIETVLLAVNQTLEVSIHISVRLDALESLLIEKGVFTEPELRAQIAKLRTNSEEISKALRTMEAGRAAS